MNKKLNVLQNENRKFSYSEITCWSWCSYRHFLKYVLNVDELETYSLSVIVGKIIHKMIAEYLYHTREKKKYNCKKERQWLAKFLQEDKINDKEAAKIIFRTYKKFKNFYENHFFDYDIIFIEQKIEDIVDFYISENQKNIFYGIIDLVLKKEDRYYIIDWKTSNIVWSEEKRNDSIKKLQLYLYKYFFSKKNNIPFEKISCIFGLIGTDNCSFEIVEINFTKEEMENNNKFIKSFLLSTKNGIHFRDTSKCEYCGYYGTKYCR